MLLIRRSSVTLKASSRDEAGGMKLPAYGCDQLGRGASRLKIRLTSRLCIAIKKRMPFQGVPQKPGPSLNRVKFPVKEERSLVM